MADNKKTKLRSKFFRVAVEGATTDGRNIERQHIQDMADSYDPALYSARIWIEHMRSLLPDSPFRAYGDVVAVKAEEVDIGGSKKLALFAQIDPTTDLVSIVNVAKQKLFTSIEIAPKFADTGKAYLQGLAVTDSPASIGTEMLAFAAENPDASPLKARKQSPENLFTACEASQIEFEEVQQAQRKGGLAMLLSNLGLAPKPEPEPKDDSADVTKLGQQLLDTFNEQEDRIEKLSAANASLNAKVNALSDQVADLRKVMDDTPQAYSQRKPVTGNRNSSAGDATDC